MSPPVALAKRWKKIKKRCSFSSSDRLVRSKSFTEHDTSDVSHEAPVIIDHVPGQYADKYLTVGSRDANRFQGLRDKIAQWNSDLKKRRSTENLSAADHHPGHERSRAEHAAMFVVASPTSGVHPVKSAVISPTVYSTASLKTPNRKSSSRVHLSPWSSPSPSPPSPSSDDLSDNQRNDSYTSQHSLYQDQDSGYDGFCPEKSIYSTGSSDTSSVMSSEGHDSSHINIMESLYSRSVQTIVSVLFSFLNVTGPDPGPDQLPSMRSTVTMVCSMEGRAVLASMAHCPGLTLLRPRWST